MVRSISPQNSQIATFAAPKPAPLANSVDLRAPARGFSAAPVIAPIFRQFRVAQFEGAAEGEQHSLPDASTLRGKIISPNLPIVHLSVILPKLPSSRTPRRIASARFDGAEKRDQAVQEPSPTMLAEPSPEELSDQSL